MTDEDFELAMDELSSAEDFLDYFRVDYEPRVVQVNRLHILQRFHDYLAKAGEMPGEVAARFTLHARLLEKAYRDFEASDALTEKVFRVFRMNEPRTASIPLGDLIGGMPRVSGV